MATVGGAVIPDIDRLHLLLITIGIFCCIGAGVITWYLIETYPDRYHEGNPVSSVSFQYLGIPVTLLVIWTIMGFVMIHVPSVFRRYKLAGLVCNLCFTVIFVLDFGNNMYCLSKEMYWIFGDTYKFFAPSVELLNNLYAILGGVA